MNSLFILLFLVSIPALAIGIVKPTLFTKLFRTYATRKKLSLIFGALLVMSFIGVGVTADPVSTTTIAEDQIKSKDVKNEEASISTEEKVETPQIEYLSINKVVDGDTIEVQQGGESIGVRLIGINTPETVDPRKGVECFGKEASSRAKELLSGKKVRLEADVTQDVKDKYGRTLAYVFLEDGTNFNKQMIAEGYAYEYTYASAYKYQSEFKAAEQDAKSNKKGLWGDGTCKGSLVFPSTEPVKDSSIITPKPSQSSTTVAPAPASSTTSAPSTPAQTSGVVKKSTTSICHAPGTTYYDRTINYTSYNSIEACIASGGRLPKN
jgi:micrococcal nuclease